MFGIIATIVAACKGHKGFAWFTGIWTLLAIIIAAAGAPQVAIAPGGLFMIIALCQKNENKASKNQEAKKEALRYMLYCKDCNYTASAEGGSTDEFKCPICQKPLLSTGTPRSKYANKTDSEKEEIKRSWDAMTKAVPLYSLPKYNTLVSESNEQKTGEEYKTVFICESCGAEKRGWYKTCPFCGAVDSMKKVQVRINSEEKPALPAAIPEESEKLEDISAENPPMFCRECGIKLAPDAVFCPECGTKVIIAKETDCIVPEAVEEAAEVENLTPLAETPEEEIVPPVRVIPLTEEKTETEPVEKSVAADEIRFCHKCGFRLKPESLFCSHCGAKIE